MTAKASYFGKSVFPTGYFASAYFQLFTPAITGGNYFVKTYFAAQYFPGGYYPKNLGATPPRFGGDYFDKLYFTPQYFADGYFSSNVGPAPIPLNAADGESSVAIWMGAIAI